MQHDRSKLTSHERRLLRRWRTVVLILYGMLAAATLALLASGGNMTDYASRSDAIAGASD